ncbi:MAG: AAA family ATPase [Bacteroidia bacterium]
MYQEKALAILKSGKNVFLTGSAGTGKTYTLNKYIEYLREHNVPVAITASTGIAATHMSGTTIHSWSGIGIKDKLTQNDFKSLSTKKYLTKSIKKTHVLIIDEISMLHRNQLDMINKVLKYVRSSGEAFGGMQVVFSGDFFQLPPVSKNQESNREKFAFMSEAWLAANVTICYLTEQYRQSKNSLNDLLNEMRGQEVSSFSIDLLQEAKYQELPIEPTRLYTHNANVDEINAKELEALEGDKEVYFAEKSGNQKMMEGFVKSLIVQDKLVLKKGAKVMFLKNNHDLGYMNGSLGIVVDFDSDDNWPIVQLSDKRKIKAEPEVWSIHDEGGKMLVQFEQVPLRLAWAITVHKSQGMTLECAEMDLSRSFELGQGYVALSRLKDMDGLRLLGLNKMALEVDPLAAKADARFIELSMEADDQLKEDELTSLFKDHILDSGGTFDPIEIAKNKQKRKAKREKKSTLDLTADLIKEGKSLSEMVVERGYSSATIKNHIGSLAEQQPELDISAYRPPDHIISAVESSLELLEEKDNKNDKTPDGKIKLSAIYNNLKKQLLYEDIKMALVFIRRDSK